MSFSHSGTPQSLQEDYAILSRYGASSVAVQDRQDAETLSDSPRGIPIRRRSFSGTTTVFFPVSERTLLLQPTPPVPRLHEPTDGDILDAAPAEQIPTSKMFREELRTLTMYALPVFGYVLPLGFPPSILILYSSKYSPFRIFFHPGFRHIHRPSLYTRSGSRHFGFYDRIRHRIQHRTGFRIDT